MAANRQVLHTYPRSMADYGPEHYTPDGKVRSHVVGEGADQCWCGPTVLEWRERPNGRAGWVTVVPGSDPARTAAMKKE